MNSKTSFSCAPQDSDVICLSSIDWDFNWQGHQEMMSRFARRGQRVLFIENTGVRAPRSSDAFRILRRWQNWKKGYFGIREEKPNLFVYSPLVLPFPNSVLAIWINALGLNYVIRKWIRELGIQNVIFYTWLPTGLAWRIIEAIQPKVSIYFCCDNFSARTSQPQKIKKSEERLLKKTDLVLAHGIKIQERLQAKHSYVKLMQYGISEDTFFKKSNSAKTKSLDSSGKGMIYGYVGGLHEHVDQQLLVTLAKTYPQVVIQLIGPEQCDVTALRAEKNIHLLGQKEHGQLPALISKFHVGLIPYALNIYTETVFPTKLMEYLGCGIPVISTAIPEVLAFTNKFPGVVACATDRTKFIQALDPKNILADEASYQKRIAVAYQNTWASKLKEIDVWIDECLRRRTTNYRQVIWKQKFKTAWHRRKILPIGAAVLSLYLFFGTRLFWFAADHLLIPPPPNSQVDAVFVIGGGAGEGGDAGVGYVERALRASRLIRNGQAKDMVLLSGATVYIEEGRLMRGIALDQNIPKEKIILVNQGGGINQMLSSGTQIAKEKKWRRVMLVTSPYALRRGIKVWQKNNSTIQMVAEPESDSCFYDYEAGQKWWRRKNPSLKQIFGIGKELVTCFYYWMRGWL